MDVLSHPRLSTSSVITTSFSSSSVYFAGKRPVPTSRQAKRYGIHFPTLRYSVLRSPTPAVSVEEDYVASLQFSTSSLDLDLRFSLEKGATHPVADGDVVTNKHPSIDTCSASMSTFMRNPEIKFRQSRFLELEGARREAQAIIANLGHGDNIPCNRPECGDILPDVRALAYHLHVHRMEEFNARFVCSKCDNRFLTKRDYIRHGSSCHRIYCSSAPSSPGKGK